MRSITVKFDDGDSVSTYINGSEGEIADYYLGQDFTKRDETKRKAVCVKFHDTEKVLGVWARSIESGWRGMVIDVEDHGTPMFKMVGVCELSIMVAGLSLADAMSSDDIQWFSPFDLRYIKFKKKEEPCVK